MGLGVGENGRIEGLFTGSSFGSGVALLKIVFQVALRYRMTLVTVVDKQITVFHLLLSRTVDVIVPRFVLNQKNPHSVSLNLT